MGVTAKPTGKFAGTLRKIKNEHEKKSQAIRIENSSRDLTKTKK